MPESDRPWVSILAGGSGTRFWPASTPSRPKQLLPLGGPHPLFVDTVERAELCTDSERILVVANGRLHDALAPLAPALPHTSWLLEPEARGTGPALVWAAWTVFESDPRGVLVSLHSDHAIRPVERFAATVRKACRLARSESRLITVTAPATRPDPGYGYVGPGAEILDDGGAPAGGHFVEKPSAEEARELIAEGYRWNTGIFVWRVDLFLEEVRTHCPEVAPHLHHLESGDVEGFFASVDPITVDHGVLARSERIGSVSGDFFWDDVGSWSALRRTSAEDEAGNVVRGDGRVVDGTNNLIYQEGSEPVVLYGVDDLVVVSANGVLFVTHESKLEGIRPLVEQLPDTLRDPLGTSSAYEETTDG